MGLALENIKVLDLSRVLAGPFCGTFLADMGAEVIKIESTTGGDETRSWTPRKGEESAAFLACNRNKSAMCLNLKTDEGKQIFRRLVREADVLVENFRTGAMEEMDLGYEDLSRLNPRLVYCSVSAYGDTGPLKDEAGYDAAIQAYGGIMSITGDPEGPPLRCGASFTDLTTGIIAAYAVVNALFYRERTGEGQKVESSLMETAVALLNYHAQGYLLDGTVPGRLGSGHPSMVPYRNFQCRDGEFAFIVAHNDRFWERLCGALGLEHLVTDPHFADNVKRVENREKLEQSVAEQVAEYDRGDLLELLAEAGVPAVPVNTVDRLMQEPQVQHREMIQTVHHPTLGELKVLGQPMKFSAMESRPAAPAPTYGEHTYQILHEYGYSEEEMSELSEKGVIR